MTNLWKETISELTIHGKSFDDVKYIQGSDFGITKENFEQLARNTVYDSGYGTAEVAEDLVIVGDNWWIERGIFDGAEWWYYRKMPKQINDIKKVNHLAGGIGTGDTLAELNETEVEK